MAATKAQRGPADHTISQPSQRVFNFWTPPLIKAAFVQAEAGNVRLAAELCDNMLADDRINTVYDTRVGGLLGLDLEFEASGDGRRKNKAVKALEIDEDWWEMFPESELWPLLVWGRHFGTSFGQLHPAEHMGRIVPKLEFWHPRNTRFDWGKRQWFARVDGGAIEVPIVPGDGQWIQYSPYGNYRPWASGLWRGLARWWLLKSYAQDDAGRRSEKAGTLFIEDSLDGNDPVEARQIRKDIAQDMQAAGRDAVVVLPSGLKANALDWKDTISANQGAIIDMANSAISIAVLGQNLTTEVSGGSYAAATVHSKVQIQRIRSDSETAATAIHDQALEWWAEFNFGSRDLAPWPKWRTDPPTDQVARASSISAVATALSTLKLVGKTISNDQLETDFDLDLEDLTPEQLAAMAPPAPEPIEPDPDPVADAADPTDKTDVTGDASADKPPTLPKAAARAAAPKKKLSRAKRYSRSVQPPDGPIAAYQVAVRGLVKRWWDKAGPQALAKAEAVCPPSESRAPSDEADADIELDDFSVLVDAPAFTAEVNTAAKSVGKHNDAEFKRIGIKLSKSDPGVSKLVPGFRKENVGLIKTMLADEKAKLEQLLADGAVRRFESLAADIEERFGVTTRHAELIASDQCLKLNANIAHERMQNAGITQFQWTTAGDERVRPLHAELDGQTFSFDDPPVTNEDDETNLPGEDINCRCVSFAILDELLDDSEDDDIAAE